jgi:hypothetical protein
MEREHEKVLNDTLEAQKKLLKVEKTFEVSTKINFLLFSN